MDGSPLKQQPLQVEAEQWVNLIVWTLSFCLEIYNYKSVQRSAFTNKSNFTDKFTLTDEHKKYYTNFVNEKMSNFNLKNEDLKTMITNNLLTGIYFLYVIKTFIRHTKDPISNFKFKNSNTLTDKKLTQLIDYINSVGDITFNIDSIDYICNSICITLFILIDRFMVCYDASTSGGLKLDDLFVVSDINIDGLFNENYTPLIKHYLGGIQEIFDKMPDNQSTINEINTILNNKLYKDSPIIKYVVYWLTHLIQQKNDKSGVVSPSDVSLNSSGFATPVSSPGKRLEMNSSPKKTDDVHSAESIPTNSAPTDKLTESNKTYNFTNIFPSDVSLNSSVFATPVSSPGKRSE